MRPEPCRRGRRQDTDEPGIGETPHVVAEHPRRERPLADDDARMGGRIRDLAGDHLREHEIANRTVAVPALKAGLVDNELGLRLRVVPIERLEPRNARIPVPELAARFGIVEVLPEPRRVGGVETESLQTPDALLTPHGVRTPTRASRARRRSGEACGRD